MRARHFAFAALIALGACGSGSDEADQPAPQAETATEIAPANTPPASADADDIDAIPAAFHGRWGLVAADCEPGRADAKGLLTIGTDRLEFYESVATLNEVQDASPTGIRATFDFTGEGMSWERDMAFELEDGAATMVRSEFENGAITDTFRYAKCNQGR